ncbi:hypothetical protein Tco_0860398 [Tanacetum coccineum]|uniref:Nuclear speckle splicing regulatory protein 1 N-terminal domain-containing protein n=1 Tax=Tanacetum coccineum TaxID=301880 RepID=A0ABQ5BET0_9ASTR
MAMCTKLSKQVLNLKKQKNAQFVEILKLKKRVKKLERQRKSSISQPRRRIYRQVESFDDDLDDEDAYRQGRTSDKTKPMFKDSDFNDLDDLVDEGMDFTLIKIKEEKAKEKGVAIKDVKDSSRPIRLITTLQPLLTIDHKDKELDEELRIERERQEEASKFAIAEMFDEVHARIDADYELAARMTQEEQEKYTIEERARHSQLKGNPYEEIQGLYERQQKRIQDFTPMDSEKEAQKSSKKLKRVAGSYTT